MNDMIIGVDLAKNVFQVHGALRTGELKFRKKLTRQQFTTFMAQQAPCLIMFEACGGAHYWAREMEALGHAAHSDASGRLFRQHPVSHSGVSGQLRIVAA